MSVPSLVQAWSSFSVALVLAKAAIEKGVDGKSLWWQSLCRHTLLPNRPGQSLWTCCGRGGHIAPLSRVNSPGGAQNCRMKPTMRGMWLSASERRRPPEGGLRPMLTSRARRAPCVPCKERKRPGSKTGELIENHIKAKVLPHRCQQALEILEPPPVHGCILSALKRKGSWCRPRSPWS